MGEDGGTELEEERHVRRRTVGLWQRQLGHGRRWSKAERGRARVAFIALRGGLGSDTKWWHGEVWGLGVTANWTFVTCVDELN